MRHPRRIILRIAFLIILLSSIKLEADSQSYIYDTFHSSFAEKIRQDSLVGKIRTSRVYWNYTYIGRYKEAAAGNNYVYEFEDSLIQTLEKVYRPVDAREHILSKTKDYQVVMINEGHHRPEHRVFTRILLKGLYLQGFRYFGLEAIATKRMMTLSGCDDIESPYNLADTSLQRRGYPLMKPISGTYTKEPQMANMIREAIEIGFTIFGYEGPLGANRELEQAKNIQKILKLDPLAKILIHCGYGHLYEKPFRNTGSFRDTLMGLHFKKLTGLDPLTIDQTSYISFQSVSERIFEKYTNFSIPIVFLDQEGREFQHLQEDYRKFDLTVFHPPARYINERPDWLLLDDTVRTIEIDIKNVRINGPYLIKLLTESDRLDAVPVDIFQPYEDQNIVTLMAKPGKYKVLIENERGERLIEQIEIRH